MCPPYLWNEDSCGGLTYPDIWNLMKFFRNALNIEVQWINGWTLKVQQVKVFKHDPTNGHMVFKILKSYYSIASLAQVCSTSGIIHITS